MLSTYYIVHFSDFTSTTSDKYGPDSSMSTKHITIFCFFCALLTIRAKSRSVCVLWVLIRFRFNACPICSIRGLFAEREAAELRFQGRLANIKDLTKTAGSWRTHNQDVIQSLLLHASPAAIFALHIFKRSHGQHQLMEMGV